MGNIDVRPQIVDIAAYAGDTLSITVTVSDSYSDGKEWKAAICAVRGQAIPDSEWTCTPFVGGAILSLTAAQTRALADKGVLLKEPPAAARRYGTATPTASAVVRYTGQWDVQIADVGGVDPITTLAQGTLTIDLDVTEAS